MESQALGIMRPQVERLERYPEVKAMLQQHIAETETQIERLGRLPGGTGESASSIEDAVLSAVSGMASLQHAAAGDEVLKNAFANHAFENFEIAAYASLLASARRGGGGAAPRAEP